MVWLDHVGDRSRVWGRRRWHSECDGRELLAICFLSSNVLSLRKCCTSNSRKPQSGRCFQLCLYPVTRTCQSPILPHAMTQRPASYCLELHIMPPASSISPKQCLTLTRARGSHLSCTSALRQAFISGLILVVSSGKYTSER